MIPSITLAIKADYNLGILSTHFIYYKTGPKSNLTVVLSWTWKINNNHLREKVWNMCYCLKLNMKYIRNALILGSMLNGFQPEISLQSKFYGVVLGMLFYKYFNCNGLENLFFQIHSRRPFPHYYSRRQIVSFVFMIFGTLYLRHLNQV